MNGEKMQHCFWCGKELGVYSTYRGDIEACGESVCQREQRDAYRQQEEEIRESAEMDDYSRYR